MTETPAYWRTDATYVAVRRQGHALRTELARLDHIAHRAFLTALITGLRADGCYPAALVFSGYYDEFAGEHAVRFEGAETADGADTPMPSQAHKTVRDAAIFMEYDDVPWYEAYWTVTVNCTDPDVLTVYGTSGDGIPTQIDTWPVDNPAAGLEPTEQDT